MIGEEFFTASAYLSGKPEMLGSIKGQDIVKSLIMLSIITVLVFDVFNQIGLVNFNITKFLTF